jgi:hypothetical protein
LATCRRIQADQYIAIDYFFNYFLDRLDGESEIRFGRLLRKNTGILYLLGEKLLDLWGRRA